MLSHLSMEAVKSHYLKREKVHRQLLNLFQRKDAALYVPLALGVTSEFSNYSASEHGLGVRAIAENGIPGIFQLAEALYTSSKGGIPERVYAHRLKWLKISTGSEMSMMLRPNKFWVANVRTIWADLLIEHGDDYQKANQILEIYRDPSAGDPNAGMTSEMDYSKWREIHARLEATLNRLHSLGVTEAERQGVEAGDLKYLWADAIANELYQERNTRLLISD